MIGSWDSHYRGTSQPSWKLQKGRSVDVSVLRAICLDSQRGHLYTDSIFSRHCLLTLTDCTFSSFSRPQTTLTTLGHSPKPLGVYLQALRIEGNCSVQFSHSVVSDSATPWTAARQGSLSITNSQSLLKLISIESVTPSNHLILCRPLLLPPSIFPSIRVFSNESVLHIRWPKYWSFSFNISPSREHSGLISFRMDWLDLLAVQGTL